MRDRTLPLLLGAVILGACESVPTPPVPPTHPVSPAPSVADVDPRVAQGYTDFSFEVFRSLTEATPNGNVFFSGTSLAFALAMTYHGAEGETRGEMGRMLGVDGVALTEFNASNAAWLSALVDEPGDTELAIANSVWARLGFPFESDFLQRNETHYRATVRELDFADAASVDVINGWVSEQTRGRIDKIVESIQGGDIMFLINAVYFRGEWTTPFSKDGTAAEPFMRPGGTPDPIPMMTRRDTLEYYAGEGYEAVRLPYGEDERFAMYVFLPAPDSDLPAFYQGLDAAEWERRIGRLEPTYLELRLPRFTLEYRKQLIPTLQGLGMEHAFEPGRADFSGMTPAGGVYISEVLQKTFVQVNETGTEAAAVTSVRMGIVSAPSYPTMLVNRPFFFALRDDDTGTVLFQGQVTDPEAPEWDGS